LAAGKEGSTSFLKKRSKKLLHILASVFPDTLGLDSQKFFGSFFQKRTACLHTHASGGLAPIEATR
jgi:hypothetical protein